MILFKRQYDFDIVEVGGHYKSHRLKQYRNVKANRTLLEELQCEGFLILIN